MSKIKNGGLDQYGDEPFEQQQFGTAGVEGVNWLALLDSRFILIHSVPIYLSIYLSMFVSIFSPSQTAATAGNLLLSA